MSDEQNSEQSAVTPQKLTREVMDEAVKIIQAFLSKQGLSDSFELSSLYFSGKNPNKYEVFEHRDDKRYRYEEICRYRFIDGKWVLVCDYGYVRE